MFLTQEDYIQVGADALKIMQQASDDNRYKAEARAISLIKGYLRPRYDVEAVFNAQGEERDMTLVGYAIDIALYYLVASLPQRMGFEIREKLFEQAVAWLKDVQRGNIQLDLPPAPPSPDGSDADSATGPIRFGTGIRNDYFW